MTRFGVVGLGIIGSGIANRLADVNQGPVAVFTRSGAEPREGWIVHPTAEALAQSVDVVVVAVPTAEAVEQVLFAEEGVVSTMAPGGIVVNVATVGPEGAMTIGRRVVDAGIGYVDAPVLGSRDAARSGGLVVLAGGAEDALDRCGELFEAIAARVVPFTQVGDASKAKLLYNALLGIGMAATVDLLQMANSMGLDREYVFNEVLASPVASPAMKMKGQAVQAGATDVHFPLQWMLKDLRLAQSVNDGPSAVTQSAVNLFDQAVGLGLGEEDFSSVVRVLDRAGTENEYVAGAAAGTQAG